MDDRDIIRMKFDTNKTKFSFYPITNSAPPPPCFKKILGKALNRSIKRNAKLEVNPDYKNKN